MFALKKFHKHQYGRSFEIITDHKPLVSFFGELKQVPTTASPRIQRWAVTLCGYEYNIHYKAGTGHCNADCLGRLPLTVTVKSESEEHVLLIDELDCSLVGAEQLSRYIGRDPTLAHVCEYLMRGWPAGENDAQFAPYKCRRDELSVQDRCVLWGARVITPPQCRQEVMQQLHLAHPEINRMKGLARSYVWWPGMDKDLEKMVQRCDTC